MKNPFRPLSSVLLRRLLLVAAAFLLPAPALRAQIAVTVPGTSNLWLAGVITGTTASTGQDNLRNATPFQVPGVTLTPGTSLTFSAVSGNVSNDPDRPVSVGPDGGPFLGFTLYTHDKENGIAKLVAPVNSLIGVFLDDSVPNPLTAPDGYDLSQPPGTIYTLIAPALRKPFFIGDGKTDDGTVQKIIVPAGATRLFLGSLDPSDQENNLGSFAVTVNGAGSGTGGGTNGGRTFSLPLTTGADNKLDLGAFAPGVALTLTFSGTGDLVDSRYQVKPDGSLAGPASDRYNFANNGAPYPTVNGGDGVNHFPGGGANYDNVSGQYGFAGSTLTDTNLPANSPTASIIRFGTVVGTFSASPTRGDWFYLGNGTTVQVPPGGAHLYVAVDDVLSGNQDNHGAYAGTLSVGGVVGAGAPVLAVTDATYTATSDGTGATAIPNDKLTYAFTVRNTGSADATNVVVTTVLNGVKFKSASDGGTANGPQVVFNLGTLAAQSSRTLTVSAKVPAAFPTDGRIVGFAVSSVRADAPADPLASQPGLNSTVLSPYQTSVAYNSNVGPGDVLTFRFTTANRSTADVTNATSVIHLPDGVKFLAVNAEDGSVLNVAPNGNNDLVFPIALLQANQSVVYSVSFRVLYNSAADATITLLPPLLQFGSASYPGAGVAVKLNGVPAGNPPKLALTKAIVDPFSLAGLFLFDPARAATLAAAFPRAGLFTTDPATGQPAPNSLAILTFGNQLNPFIGLDDSGSAGGGQIRTVTAPNNKQPATYVTFILLYENTGASSASDFSITDRVPEGFAFVPDAPAPSVGLLGAPYALINSVPVTPDNLQVTDNGRTLNFRVKNKLKPGQSGLIVYQLQVIPAAQGGPNPGAIVTTTGARITSTSIDGGVVASPDGEPLLVTAPTHFSFRTFAPGNNTGAVGQPATFQFYYKNDGGKKTTAFAIKVPLPANTTFASASVLGGPGADGVTRAADGGALFTIGKVKPGESGLVQFSFIPTAAAVQAGKAVSVNFLPAYDGVSFATPAAATSRSGTRARGAHPHPHLLGVDPLPVGVVFRPVTDLTAPRIFIQRSAPLVVENGKPFDYQIVVGNLGDHATDQAVIYHTLPKGLDAAQITGNNGPVVTTRTADGRLVYGIPLNNGIPAHGVRAVKVQLKVNPDLFNADGITSVTDDKLYAIFVGSGVQQTSPVYCPPASTRLLKRNETLALAGSDLISGSLAAYGFDASAVRTVARAVSTNSRTTTIGGADVLTTNNGALIVPLGTSAGQRVAAGLGPVLVSGPAGVVSNDGGSLISDNGLGLISQDGSGLIAAGAGNLIKISGLISQDGSGFRGGVPQTAGGLISSLISDNGLGLVAAGAGNLIRGGGLNLISQDGSGLISNDGSGLIGNAGGTLVAAGAGNIVATGYSNLIGNAGGTIISDNSGGLIAAGAGNFLANGGGKFIATGGGNAISDSGSGLIGSSPNTAALVAAGAGNLIGVSGGSIIGEHSSGLVAAGAGN